MTRPRPGRVARGIRQALVALLVVVVLVALAGLTWTRIVFAGERPAALEVWSSDAVEVTATDRSIVLGPSSGGSDLGFVVVPGAKVDPYAYMFKLSGVVERSGVTVVITKPTLNLAFLDPRPLSEFTADAPGVDRWLVGGHSLGGVRACDWGLDAGGVDVVGLVLLGSYCATDLSRTDLPVLSVSGSADGLSTPSDIRANAAALPADAVFVELEGVTHAQFGDYGEQPGDGEPTLDDETVRAELTDALAAFVDEVRGRVGG